MKNKTFAAIDIGSNAARLLIKTADPLETAVSGILKKQLLLRVPLRLGFDVFSKGKVSQKKADNMVRLMKAYRQLMRIYEVDEYRACATSAMRDAENGHEILRKIAEETGIKVEIIAGEEEAAIVYANHAECAGDRKGNFLYVDVGGGSTEINLISDGVLLRSDSFNIGTVRTLTGKVKPQEWTRLNDALTDISSRYPDINIIGSGGNINKLYKMAEARDEENSTFSVDELARLYHILKPLTVEQRMIRFNLKPDRADVIIPAAEIFLTVASVVKARYIMVPVIGVADGIIDQLYEKDGK